MFFAISGLIFIILSGVGRILFLPIGIALIIISILFWQRSKYLVRNEHKDSNKSNQG